MVANIPVSDQNTIPPTPDEAALRYLIENMRPGQWEKLAQALRTVKHNGGHGKITIAVKDGYVQGHVIFEGSI